MFKLHSITLISFDQRATPHTSSGPGRGRIYLIAFLLPVVTFFMQRLECRQIFDLTSAARYKTTVQLKTGRGTPWTRTPLFVLEGHTTKSDGHVDETKCAQEVENSLKKNIVQNKVVAEA